MESKGSPLDSRMLPVEDAGPRPVGWAVNRIFELEINKFPTPPHQAIAGTLDSNTHDASKAK